DCAGQRRRLRGARSRLLDGPFQRQPDTDRLLWVARLPRRRRRAGLDRTPLRRRVRALREGIAPEASDAMLRYGFEEISLSRLYAGADPPNAVSFHVIEKLGMKFARKTSVNGVAAVYYALGRNDYTSDCAAYWLLKN